MKLNELSPRPGSRKARRRRGRGMASGLGKTAGRGEKGQLSRSGVARSRLDGGQKLISRMPKRGQRSRRRAEFVEVNVGTLADLVERGYILPGQIVDEDLLRELGIIRKSSQMAKLLGRGEINAPLHITTAKASDAALDKIKRCGGTVFTYRNEDDNYYYKRIKQNMFFIGNGMKYDLSVALEDQSVSYKMILICPADEIDFNTIDDFSVVIYSGSMEFPTTRFDLRRESAIFEDDVVLFEFDFSFSREKKERLKIKYEDQLELQFLFRNNIVYSTKVNVGTDVPISVAGGDQLKRGDASGRKSSGQMNLEI